MTNFKKNVFMLMRNKVFTLILFILFFFIGVAQTANSPKASAINPFPSVFVDFIKKHEVNTGNNILLSDEDVKLYKEIFDLQKYGKWKKSEQLIKKVDNKILMGHVRYQKLMHPTKHRSSFEELNDWLDIYSDHPMSKRILRLAKIRKPGNIKLNMPKDLPRLAGYGNDIKNKKLCGFPNRINKHKNIYSKIRDLIKRGRPTQALKFLNGQKNIDQYSKDEFKGRISAGYFAVGKDQKAFEIISEVAERSGQRNPVLYWYKGIIAYRLGYEDEALTSFLNSTKVVKRNYCRAESAYWASKILSKNNSKQKSIDMLKISKSYPASFYGQLALEDLGLKNNFDWSILSIGKIFELNILNNIHLRRAIALSQIRRYGEADQEFRFLVGKVGLDKASHLIELAYYLNLPAVQIRLGDKLIEKNNEKYTFALYPAPQWISESKMKIDRALVWAIIKNESAFYLKAKSYRGARGLMQIMPSTARIVTGDRSIRGINSYKLYDLDLNIETGQKLILKLLKSEKIKHSLIKLLTAWNAGPSRLDQWDSKINIYKDPLLYIESIPSKETRLFVKKVLTDMWIYRDKFNQNKSSLKELANNKWPKYLAMEH